MDYITMTEPKDQNDICIAEKCDRRKMPQPHERRSLIPHFKSGTFSKDGLICGWCLTVYKENDYEESNNPRRS